MKLSTLLCLILILVAMYLFVSTKLEFFTPNPYLISWQKPIDDGGDENCCGYDWQINDGKIDSGSVPSSNTPIITVQTKKLDWDTKYKISVRAINMFGPGEWTTTELSTGNGVINSIVIASLIDNNDGTIINPIASGVQNVKIWTSLDKGSISPNTLQASALMVIKRDNAIILQNRVDLTNSYDSTKKIDLFIGETDPIELKIGDVIDSTIIVWDPFGTETIITEASQSVTVNRSPPNNVSGISLTYAR